MTFFILDPSLENEHGHHLNWDLGIAAAVRARGEPVMIYANRVFAAAVPADITVIPYFSHSTYASRSQDKIAGRYQDFAYFNDVLAEELAALPTGLFGAADTVLVPTLTEIHLLAYASWVKSFDPVTAPLFVMHLMFPSGVTPTEGRGFEVVDPLQALFYRLAFEVADRPGPPMYFFGGGRQIAREFSCLTGRPVAPHPVPIRPQRPSPKQKGTRPVALLYAGDAKVEKGIHLLPDLAPLLCAEHPQWDIVMHANTSTSWGGALSAMEVLRQIAPDLPNFRLHEGHLSAESYLDLLCTADCLVSTYDPKVYARKSSGVIWECISLGIPVLVPAGSWLEKEAEEWGAGAISYAGYSVDAICARFAAFVDRLPSLSARCAAASRRYQSFNGAAAIVDQIAELWVPRFMAASLGSRAVERVLPLAEIAEPGWYAPENAKSGLARWTGKEAQIGFAWPYPDGWSLEIEIGSWIGDEQITRTEASVAGAPVTVEPVLDGDSARLLITGSQDLARHGAVRLLLKLPYTYRPPHETRELGILVQRIVLRPANPDLRRQPIQADRIEIRTPSAAGPRDGSFLLRGVVSGVFWLEPHSSAEIRFTVSSAAGPEIVRSLRFYIDGQPARLDLEAARAGEWLARVPLPDAGRSRRALRGEWDLAEGGQQPGDIVIGDLRIQGFADAEQPTQPTIAAQALPLRIDAASLMVDATGFHRLEYDADGNPFRWSRAEARFYFFTDRSRPTRFRAQFGNMLAGNGPASIRCFADGQPVAAEISLAENSFQLSGLLPARHSGAGTTLNLAFPVSSPADAGSLDTRLLGAAFYWLEIEAAEAEAETPSPPPPGPAEMEPRPEPALVEPVGEPEPAVAEAAPRAARHRRGRGR